MLLGQSGLWLIVLRGYYVVRGSILLFPVWPDTHTMYEQLACGAVNSISDYIVKHNVCVSTKFSGKC